MRIDSGLIIATNVTSIKVSRFLQTTIDEVMAVKVMAVVITTLFLAYISTQNGVVANGNSENSRTFPTPLWQGGLKPRS